MINIRRAFLKSGAALTVGSGAAMWPLEHMAEIPTSFSIMSFSQILIALGPPFVASDAIDIVAPYHAESGSSVGIMVASHLPQTHKVHLLVEGNHDPWVGTYRFAEGAIPWVAVRARMTTSSTVHAIVEAGGQRHIASASVLVAKGASESDMTDERSSNAFEARVQAALPFRLSQVEKNLAEVRLSLAASNTSCRDGAAARIASMPLRPGDFQPTFSAVLGANGTAPKSFARRLDRPRRQAAARSHQRSVTCKTVRHDLR